MAPPPGCVTLQGANRSSWKAPDLETAPSVPSLVAHHLEHSPDHVYATTTAGRKISTREFLRAAHRAGRHIKRQIRDDEVVGILAEPEAFSVAAVTLGCMCAGIIPLMLSTRNSSDAIVDLCRKTDCRYLLVSPRSAPLKRLADDAYGQLQSTAYRLEILHMPDFDLIYPHFGCESAADTFDMLPLRKTGQVDEPCIILHSSGSTSFPKPVPWTHRFATRSSSWPWYGNKDICGRTWFVGATPTFHMAGISNHILVPLLTGVSIVLFDPDEHAWPPTPELVIQAIANVSPQDVSLVPAFLEAWNEDDAAVETLAKCERILFGGGPLNPTVGDRLVAARVVLAGIYGSTEVGVTNELIDRPSKDWEWLRTSRQVTLRLQPVEGDDTFVLQVLSTDRHQTAVDNLPDQRGFDTNDLVRKHPSDPNLLQIVGRADSQIMLANGEKTNPEPMEHIIEANPMVDRCLMFGRGRSACGLLVQRADVSRGMSETDVMDVIMPDIGRANKIAPRHSRILREFVLFADPSRPFEITPKKTVRRNKVLESYASDIDKTYSVNSNGTHENSNGSTLGDIVHRIVSDALQIDTVEDDVNLFSLGCDSLVAMYILRKLQAQTTRQKLPSNLVYSFPTVRQLIAHLESGATATPGDAVILEKARHVGRIEEAIHKYTAGLQSAARQKNDINARNGELAHAVLVTGTTGALGSQLLVSLLKGPSVAKVFAINRKVIGKTVHERQREALRSRNMDQAILDDQRLELLEAEFGQPGFNLDEGCLKTLRDSVTLIIHSAWRVNFNVPLSSFEPDLRGLRDLIDLALRGRHQPRLLFTSSIASLASWPADRYGPERLPDHPVLAVGQGYGESKYVGEKMLEMAAEYAHLNATVVRVGQLAGAQSTGAWTTSEWFAALVKSSETLGCLPDGADCVAWIPVDVAAQCIIDLAVNTEDGSFGFYNLVHPRPITWSSIIAPIADMLEVRLVPYAVWLDRLDAASDGDGDVAGNPALLLLDMFKHSTISDVLRPAREALDMPRLITQRAQKASVTLRSLPQLSGLDHAPRWVDYWRTMGFLGVSHTNRQK